MALEPVKLHAVLKPIGQLNASLLAGVPIPGPPGPPGPEGPQGEQGEPGHSSSVVEYLFSNNTSTPPGAGQVRFNNANQTLATKMYLDDDQATGEAIGNMLLTVPQAGAILYVQDKDDETKWQRYTLTGDPVDGGAYVEFPISWIEGGSPLVEQRVQIAITIPGPQGPPGPQGETGPQGPPGQSAGRIFYFAPSDDSDIAGYKTLLEQPSAGAEVSIPKACTGTGDFLVGNFVTEPGVPGAVPWPAGTVFRRIFASVSGGSGRLHVEVYKRVAAGTETLVRSEFSPAFSNTTVALQDWTVILPYPGVAMTATDRLVCKVYAQRVSGPATVTVTCYFEGVSGSHIQTTIAASAGVPGPVGPQGPAGLPNVIQDEGTPLTVRPAMNFVGSGVVVTDDAANGRTVVTVAGGSQTPWTGDVDAAGFKLNNTGDVAIGDTAAQTRLWVKGPNGNPSLGAHTGIFTIASPNTLALEIGCVDGGDYPVWIQGRTTGTGGSSSYPLALNPLGGNVGIGVTNPIAKLHVTDWVAIDRAVLTSRPAVDPARIPGEISGIGGGSAAADNGFLRVSAGGGTTPGSRAYIDISGYSAVADLENTIVLGTRNAERMRIGATGNVGIGTSSPGSKLDVNGDINISAGSVYRIGGSPWNPQTPWTSNIDAAGHDLNNAIVVSSENFSVKAATGTTGASALLFNYAGRLIINTGGGQRVEIGDTGSVGIGVFPPSYKLDVAGDIRCGGNLLLDNTGGADTTPGIMRLDGYVDTFYLVNNSGAGNGIIFRVNPNLDALIIKPSTGNVGIGTSLPGSKLSVVGLPTSASGLSSGDIWRDSAAGNVLKIVP